jgi:hypothetical protein
MNSKFVLGIILLALLVLTGMVSAATTGKADLNATVNLPTPTLSLTISGSQGAWIMDHVGVNQNPTPRPQLSVTSVGYPNGYTVSVADKLSPPTGVAIPPGPAGFFTIYNAQVNSFTGIQLKNRLVASLPCPSISITGSDQACFINTADFGPNDLRFNQTVDGTDQNGNYRIFITYTATPN